MVRSGWIATNWCSQPQIRGGRNNMAKGTRNLREEVEEGNSEMTGVNRSWQGWVGKWLVALIIRDRRTTQLQILNAGLSYLFVFVHRASIDVFDFIWKLLQYWCSSGCYELTCKICKIFRRSEKENLLVRRTYWIRGWIMSPTLSGSAPIHLGFISQYLSSKFSASY